MMFLHLAFVDGSLGLRVWGRQAYLQGWGGDAKLNFIWLHMISSSFSRSCALGAVEPARDGLQRDSRKGLVLPVGNAWQPLPSKRRVLSPPRCLAGSAWWGKYNTLVDNTGRGERL